MGKWYIGEKTAEGCACFAIELTDEERMAIQKFIDAQNNMYDEGYSGYFEILDSGPFDTKREAVEWAIKKLDYCQFEFGGLPSEEIERLIDTFTNGGN